MPQVCGQAYSTPSDAWSLGICLYEMAALRRPFEAHNQLALAKQIVDERFEELPEVGLRFQAFRSSFCIVLYLFCIYFIRR